MFLLTLLIFFLLMSEVKKNSHDDWELREREREEGGKLIFRVESSEYSRSLTEFDSVGLLS